ncbi:MFS transporter [Bifidobacterium bombi]|uniref:Major facilitator family transporter n=1 Tax=Bifidobacterium bombi DSM 19703 TaxID=1341695 RepID=A0A086BNN6_9BIFI|nr:MFS transporter [Bifidobacterium bombi]KFF30550.1 major facilitator family transporter [Bifidobacterium bombi DSM 19703]
MEVKSESALTKSAVLGISLILTSAPAINGALPAMRHDLNIGTSQNELLSTIPSLAVIVFIILSGFVERWLGTKKTIFISMILAGLGGIGPMFLSSYPLIFISRLLLGCGLGLYNSLAVNIISQLYQGDTRATLLGFRGSMENIGQCVLTVLAGLLLSLGWHWSYAIYLLAFPLAIFFYMVVPEPAKDDETLSVEEKTKAADSDEGNGNKIDPRMDHLHPFVWVLVLFSVFMVLDSLCSTLRFPSISVGIKGEGYNASFFLSLMPILGILAGLVFGYLNRKIGIAVLYIGIALYVVGNVLMAMSAHNFAFALIGMMIIGIPGAWCFPYIYTTIGEIMTPRMGTLATSLILIGCNIGNFISPLYMGLVGKLFGTDSLTAPFIVLAVVFALILIGLGIWNICRVMKRR